MKLRQLILVVKKYKTFGETMIPINENKIKQETINHIIQSEERAALGGSVVLNDGTKDYDRIPENVKLQYDLIRIKLGVSPRWLRTE